MRKQMLAGGLILGLAAGILASCGKNDNSTPTVLGKGSLITFIGDSPAFNVLSLRTTVSGMTFRQQGTTNKVTVFPSSSSTTSLVKVNFASLRDLTTVLTIASVPATTYDEVSLTLSGMQIVLYDPSKEPPVRTVTAKLSNSAPVIPLWPPLKVSKGELCALRLDFDMARSIRLDPNGEVNGNVTPVLTATSIDSTEGHGFGALEDLVGFIRAVMPYQIGTDFTGGFTMQLLSGTGPAVTINLNDSTALYDIYQEGAPALNKVETGRMVEVDALVDQNGNLVAKTVEIEGQAVYEDEILNFLGSVISVTKDAEGNVVQFTFYVREEEPDFGGGVVPLDSVVTVKLAPPCPIPPPTPVTPPSCTTFLFSSRPTNFASLPFGPTAVAPGQELIVHGKYTKTASAPTTVDADMICLKLQTMQGSFSSLVQVGSDGKTGGFWFTPSLSLLQQAPVLILSNNETVFTNVFGLADLVPQATLLVKGLPFYQAQAGSINGITVPAGTLVVTARQIHQLE
jgi:hypothetical protein